MVTQTHFWKCGSVPCPLVLVSLRATDRARLNLLRAWSSVIIRGLFSNQFVVVKTNHKETKKQIHNKKNLMHFLDLDNEKLSITSLVSTFSICLLSMQSRAKKANLFWPINKVEFFTLFSTENERSLEQLEIVRQKYSFKTTDMLENAYMSSFSFMNLNISISLHLLLK